MRKWRRIITFVIVVCFFVGIKTYAAEKDSDKIIVVLDPGHGGIDGGASRVYNGVMYIESHINLKIAQYCKEELEQYEGVEVYMTRTDNSSRPGLTERVDYAEGVDADCLVSIHINASENSGAYGAEVIVPSINYNMVIHNHSVQMGEMILSQLSSLGLANRGTYFRNCTNGKTYPDGSLEDYHTIIIQSKLRGISGFIVEHAYISNYSDTMNYLQSEASLKRLGIADATAIAEYYGLDWKNEVLYVVDGIDYSPVIDVDYYLERYPDINQAFNGNRRKALNHFIACGMSEGREGCAEFDVNSYKLLYGDLRRAYRNDLKKYYLHYILYGRYENRIATGVTTLQDFQTIQGGIDYSAVYNYEEYINRYPDIKAYCGGDDIKALEHFVGCGMSEGRIGREAFDVHSYRFQYGDLRRAYRNNLKEYYMHYIQYGKYENRITIGVTSLQNCLTTYNGTDYDVVYDFYEYINRYPDIKAYCGNDDVKALEHFVQYGMSEGRMGQASFDVNFYKAYYTDLQNVFGNDVRRYYLHYITWGKNEGRIASELQ